MPHEWDSEQNFLKLATEDFYLMCTADSNKMTDSHYSGSLMVVCSTLSVPGSSPNPNSLHKNQSW